VTDPDTDCSKAHPDAEHGFNRSRSLNEDRYVCDCEGWKPQEDLAASQGHAPATIDVERLAREAGIGIESFADYKRSNPHYIAKPEQMRAYAALVLEEAARVCEERAGRFIDDEGLALRGVAERIRALKPK
jgi:hypothetical protein